MLSEIASFHVLRHFLFLTTAYVKILWRHRVNADFRQIPSLNSTLSGYEKELLKNSWTGFRESQTVRNCSIEKQLGQWLKQKQNSSLREYLRMTQLVMFRLSQLRRKKRYFYNFMEFSLITAPPKSWNLKLMFADLRNSDTLGTIFPKIRKIVMGGKLCFLSEFTIFWETKHNQINGKWSFSCYKQLKALFLSKSFYAKKEKELATNMNEQKNRRKKKRRVITVLSIVLHIMHVL